MNRPKQKRVDSFELKDGWVVEKDPRLTCWVLWSPDGENVFEWWNRKPSEAEALAVKKAITIGLCLGEERGRKKVTDAIKKELGL